MKKLILILSLVLCLILSSSAFAWEKVDISGTGFDSEAAYALKIQTFLSHLSGGVTGKSIKINRLSCDDTTLQIHSHQAAEGVEQANEFKGESLSTTGGMTGIVAQYILDATGTAALTSIMGIAYLGDGHTLSGSGYLIGVSGGADVPYGTLNGSGVIVAGVVGGIMPMVGGTLTECKYMTAIWASSMAVNLPVTGESQLLLMTNGLGATLDQAIYIAGSDRITEFIHFVDVAGMVTAGTTQNATVTCDAKIAITIDALGTFYIPAYAGTVTLD